MNKKKVTNLTKKLVAGCLALSMIVAGIVVTPKTAEAEGEIGSCWRSLREGRRHHLQ